MTDIIKQIDRGVAPSMRQVTFDQSDASSGDVILVTESLGGPASNISISATTSLTVKFNVYRTLFKPRIGNDLMYSAGEPNLTTGTRYHNTQTTEIALSAGETFDNNGEFPVESIEIVSSSGNYEIFLTL